MRAKDYVVTLTFMHSVVYISLYFQSIQYVRGYVTVLNLGVLNWSKTMKAVWNGTVVAESSKTVVVEENHYFPPDAIEGSLMLPSETTSVCGWKGIANYWSLSVDGQINTDAVWSYLDPKEAATEIKGYYAFWKGVDFVK